MEFEELKRVRTLLWINHYPFDSAIGFGMIIHWIVIYPMDSVIHLFEQPRPGVQQTTCKLFG